MSPQARGERHPKKPGHRSSFSPFRGPHLPPPPALVPSVQRPEAKWGPDSSSWRLGRAALVKPLWLLRPLREGCGPHTKAERCGPAPRPCPTAQPRGPEVATITQGRTPGFGTLPHTPDRVPNATSHSSCHTLPYPPQEGFSASQLPHACRSAGPVCGPWLLGVAAERPPQPAP